jgi:predicted phage terminase large subunit-like protein
MILSNLTRENSNQIYTEVSKDHDVEALRRLCKEDLFFLLTVACNRKDIDRDWLYDRCREVERAPNGYLDLWAREHYKSTIITFGKTIQDILRDSNITTGIFSHTRPIAKAFLEQIKRELETNDFLKDLFPDVLYQEPSRESPRWSLDSGIIVKRDQNPKECTVEAFGLVDGQPTSKHFSLLVYDDVVTRESVSTTDQINKTTEALALSYNLGAEGGVKRFIGTRYHYNDTYRVILERETAIPRIYPATHDGLMNHDSIPVFMSRETLLTKYKDMGVFVFSAQMLQNPAADKAMSFKPEWIQKYDRIAHEKIENKNLNYYVLVDPASEKKKDNDYTVIVVIGLGSDGNYYLVDGIRDRLNLAERTRKLFRFVRKYRPLNVGYEKYGLQCDIEHFRYVMAQENWRFRITPLGGQTSKNDRIKSLVPIFESYLFYVPYQLYYIDYEDNLQDFTADFENEYDSFPVSIHDDVLDCIARIKDKDLGLVFPKDLHVQKFSTKKKKKKEYHVLPGARKRRIS